MSLFLSAFLGCLLAMFVVVTILGICMIVAVIEYKKKQQQKADEMKSQLNNLFNGGASDCQ